VCENGEFRKSSHTVLSRSRCVVLSGLLSSRICPWITCDGTDDVSGINGTSEIIGDTHAQFLKRDNPKPSEVSEHSRNGAIPESRYNVVFRKQSIVSDHGASRNY
jgi:hypothetical protein